MKIKYEETHRHELLLTMDDNRHYGRVLLGSRVTGSTGCILITSHPAPWLDRDDARQLAAILNHFADTGELKGVSDEG